MTETGKRPTGADSLPTRAASANRERRLRRVELWDEKKSVKSDG